MESSANIPNIKIRIPIVGPELTLNVCGDFHYGANGNLTKQDLIDSLNKETDKYRNNIFRLFTGDLIENQLKTSVGHNYGVAEPDPSIQKTDMIEILQKTNEHLYGKKIFNKLKISKGTSYKDILAVGVEGNHEYRTRKTSGQWLSREIHEASKTLDLGFGGVIELTIFNSRLKMEKIYRIFVAHRPSKTDATSVESILRAFRKKLSVLPGIDIMVFGHFHRRFISSDGYFDSRENEFKKILFVVNPSPIKDMEYADEAGYPPLKIGYGINIFMPLDPQAQCYGIV